MKSWERERRLREEGREEGLAEERINTERERKRADEAEEIARRAQEELKASIKRIDELEKIVYMAK